MITSPKTLAATRPAESGTALIGAIIVLVNAFVDLDPVVQSALYVILLAAPGVITWIVDMARNPS